MSPYKNFLFDFDGTIVDMKIDWCGLRQEIDESFSVPPDKSFQNLSDKIDFLKTKTNKIFEVIKKYEQPDDRVFYCINKHVLSLLNKIDSFMVISNNLHSTIERVLSELSLLHRCKKIVGIDDTILSKPDIGAFHNISSLLNPGMSVFIGDRETDRIFACRCNIDFCFTNSVEKLLKHGEMR